MKEIVSEELPKKVKVTSLCFVFARHDVSLCMYLCKRC